MDSGASLHMMSKNELTSKDRHQKIRRIHCHHDRQRKAESTEEATVCINDLDFLSPRCCWKIHQQCDLWFYDSPAVLSLGLLYEEMSYFYEWKKERASMIDKRWKIARCKSENHVPMLAVSKRTSCTRRPREGIG